MIRLVALAVTVALLALIVLRCLLNLFGDHLEPVPVSVCDCCGRVIGTADAGIECEAEH